MLITVLEGTMESGNRKGRKRLKLKTMLKEDDLKELREKPGARVVETKVASRTRQPTEQHVYSAFGLFHLACHRISFYAFFLLSMIYPHFLGIMFHLIFLVLHGAAAIRYFFIFFTRVYTRACMWKVRNTMTRCLFPT